MLEDKAFQDQVFKIMERELIQKFDEQTGNASDFYGDTDDDE